MNNEDANGTLGGPICAERQLALHVVERLREAGFEAWWAGGCVRDLLMNREPTDYDVATSATPQQVRQLFGLRRTMPVGVAFGVVLVTAASRPAKVEVATFRTDASYSDGRHPDSVTFSSAREDAFRRDFTINGMFYDPIDRKVIDYVGGCDDLNQRLVRAIGCADDRLAEDKLRMLRAIRFAVRFEFDLEQETFAAVVRHAKEVSQISGERILIEIQKTLTEERASWGVQKWVESELLAAILPEIQRNWVASGKLTLAILDAMPKKPWLSKLAAMLWCSQHARSEVSHSSRGNLELESAGCAAPIACDTDDTLATLKSRLKLSNYELDALRLAVQLQVKLCNAQLEPWSRIQPALVLPHITYALNVFEARAAVCGGGLTATSSWLARQLELPTEQLNPPALVDGGDLIALGFAPGPEFAGLLREVRARQLDGQLQDRTTAAEWLVQRLDEG